MNSNKFTSQIKKYARQMNEALNRKDFDTYDILKNLQEETISEYKRNEALKEERNTNNFGVLNHIFEDALPKLFKSNRKAVKSFIKTIQEDKNLLSQFQFYNALKQYDGKEDSKKYLDEALSLTKSRINCKTINESNAKLKKILNENNIIGSDFIDKDSMSLYENCNYILTKEKTINNMNHMTECKEKINSYMDSHIKPINEEKTDVLDMIKEYKNSLKANLTEEEQSLVKQITDFRTPIAEDNRKKLFNKFKNECIEKVNKMLQESEGDDKFALMGLKEQLSKQEYCAETIVKDIAKLLEIRDVLLEN